MIPLFSKLVQCLRGKKLASSAQFESEDRLGLFLEGSFDWEYWTASDGGLIEINSRCEDVTGYSPAEFKSNPNLLSEIVHPEDRKKFEEHLKEVHTHWEKNILLTFRILTKTGEIRYIEHGCRPVFSSEGEFLGRRVSNRDVTRRHEAEWREGFLSAVAASIPEAVVVTDRDRRMVYVNRQTLLLYGYSEEELLGKTPGMFLDRQDQELEKAIDRALKEGEPVSGECANRRRDGSVFLCAFNVFPLRDRSGFIQGLVGIHRDVTGQRAFELQLHEANRQLEEAERIAGLGHWTLDLATETLEWTAQTRRMFGLGENDPLTYNYFWQTVHPDDRQRVAKAWEDAVAKRTLYEIEHRIIVHGELRWVRERADLSSARFGKVVGTVLDISELKFTEQALRQERDIFAAGPVFTLEWKNEPGWPVAQASSNVGQILGISREELLAPTFVFSSIVHPDDEERIHREIVQSIAEGRTSYEQSFRIRLKSGEYRWFHDFTQILRDESGKVVRFRGYLYDETARILAEESLRLEEERFRKLFELSPIGMAINDLETGQFLAVNSAFVSPSGFSKEELLRLTFWNITPEEYLAQEQVALQALRQSGRYGPYEKEYIRKNGTRYPVLLNGFATTDPTGRTLIFSTIEDITQRKKAEEQLRLLARAVEQSQAGIVITDTEGTIEYANPAFTTITGYSVDEAIGQNPRILKSGHTDPEVYRNMWRTILDGQVWSGEILNRRKDGTLFWENLQISPVANSKGKITNFLAIKEDITARKETEVRLREMNLQLEESTARAQDLARKAEAANRAKSEFLANMSHEIRTPMNGIIGMAELLLDSPLDATQKKFCELLRSSATSLLNILNDILDLSKIEAGRLELQPAEFSLLEFLEEFAEFTDARARQQGLAFYSIHEASLPEFAVGDSVRLRQILNNLVGNALKFTEHGRIIVRAGARPAHNDPQSFDLVVSVADTGQGISPEQLPRLFQRFEQLDSSLTRKHGGTGLGLAICRELCEMMDGSIRAESTPGAGSTFSFQVRLLRCPNPPASTIPPVPDSLRKAPGIMLVLTDPLLQEAMRESLGALGIPSSAFSSLDEAVTVLEAAAKDSIPYRAIIVEGAFGIAEDFEATVRRLYAGAAHPPCIRICTVKGEEMPVGSRNPFCPHVLMKPVRRAELARVLQEVCTEAAKTGKSPTPAQEGSTAPHRQAFTGRVLVAEDHHVNQLVIRSHLGKFGLTADLVADGAAAVEAYKNTAYDLILMDVQMPGMDGLEAARLIRSREAQRADGSRIPIVALTAHAMHGDREVCIAAGMDDYLSKPVTVAALEQILQRWMPGGIKTPPK